MNQNRDITLGEDDRWLRDVFEIFPLGILLTDVGGRIRQVNAELEKQFGYTSEELLGQPIEILLPESSRDGHPALRDAYLAGAEKRSMGYGRELFGRRKDGTHFPLEIGLNPFMTSGGEAVIATIADISHRIRLENNFKKIIAAAPFGMLMMNPQGEITLSNDHLNNLFGYGKDELVGRNLESLLPERYRGRHVGSREVYCQDPQPRAMGPDRDLTGRHKNGSEIPVVIGLNPVDTDSGTEIIAAVVDITERKKAELELRTANADLDEFTYVASHDLKSPLRGIANLLEWIEEDLGESISAEVKHNLERANLRISRMENLIEDLFSYARAGRESGDFITIDVRELIDNAVKMIDLPNTFILNIDCQVGTIQSPKAPLETVMRNLIANAVKHHDREHGQIDVLIREQNSYCAISVTDDGPGIPTSAHERIFKLFQTLSAGTSSSSGVGLAVTKRLIDTHGGKIEVVSSGHQRGTCFKFIWPRFIRRDLDE